MSYIDDHHRRYGAMFSSEPWWEAHCALYEGPGHDWEGCDVLDQVVYALAKARGLDTWQTCPRCGTVVDQPRSLGTGHDSGDHCDHADEIEHEIRIAKLAEDRRRDEERRAALTPTQRADEDRRNAEEMKLSMHGLIWRDVQ